MIAALLAYLREGWTIAAVIRRLDGVDGWILHSPLSQKAEASKFVALPEGWVKPQ